MKLSALLSIAWLVAVAPSVSATPGHGNKHHVVHEKRHAQHPSWKRHVAPPAADQVLPMKIGLKQRGLEHMDRYLLEVADPTSPRFGQHWTAQKVAATFAPDAAAVDQTLQWLADAGIDGARVRLSAGRNWVEFNATVREAEALLNTKYHMYKHTSGAVRTACEAYGVPAHVRRHVDFVMPTVQLDGMRTAKRSLQVMDPAAIQHAAGAAFLDLSPDDLTICDQLMTIGCMRALYGFPAGTTAQAGNQLGIAEWSDYLYLPDLDIFFSNWTSPPIPAGVRPEFISIDGGKIANATVAEAPFVFESAVDFQTAYSIIYPQGTRLYQIGDGVNVDDAGTFNIFLDALDASYCTYGGGDDPSVDPAYPDPQPGGYQGPKQCGGAPLSNVISFSYSQVEAELPVSYQRRQCNEWGKLALLGVSVIHSSGDAGVANRHNAGVPNSCLDEKGSIKTNGTRFSPGFPATCPYLTAGASPVPNPPPLSSLCPMSFLSRH